MSKRKVWVSSLKTEDCEEYLEVYDYEPTIEEVQEAGYKDDNKECETFEDYKDLARVTIGYTTVKTK